MKKLTVFVVALLLGGTARADELCQNEKKSWDSALERAKQAREALEAYDNSELAPVVPGQADQERQKLQDSLEAKWEDVKRAMEAHDRCIKRKKCKKSKGGWKCTVAWTYEECCLDKGTKQGGNQKK